AARRGLSASKRGCHGVRRTLWPRGPRCQGPRTRAALRRALQTRADSFCRQLRDEPMTPESRVRPHKYLHDWCDPAAPREAATILLMRDGPRGPEVLMTRRSLTASFAPGAYVFPGGVIDDADASRAALSVCASRIDQSPELLRFIAAS